MKKLVVAILVGATCISGFAQGKIQIGNDSLHLVVMGTEPDRLKPADAPSAGLAAPWTGVGGALPSGSTMRVGLYAGTTSGSLSLLTTVPINGSFGAGRLQNTSYIMPGIPGGVVSFFQLKVWEAQYPSYEAAQAASALDSGLLVYATSTAVFSGTAGSGITYPPITGGQFAWLQGAAAWSPGGFQTINAVPEPSSMVLAGLGAASLLMFRRRQ